jgi:hypothetical protein
MRLPFDFSAIPLPAFPGSQGGQRLAKHYIIDIQQGFYDRDSRWLLVEERGSVYPRPVALKSAGSH